MMRIRRAPPRRYYVYVIFDLNGIPRYVGKGSGNRCYIHRLYKSHNSQLDELVKGARAIDKELPVVTVRSNLTEKESFHIEIAFIEAIGRDDLGKGTLFNRSKGGEGINENILTPEVRKRMGDAQKARDRSAGYSDYHSDAIRSGVKDFWERRRIENGGKPPSLRSIIGNEKQSKTMTAFYAKRCKDGFPPKMQRNSVSIIVDGQEMNLYYACREKGINYDTVRARYRRGMSAQQAFDLFYHRSDQS